MSSEIMVSIYCLAYNHEKYIRNTLDGFLKQITDFRVEIIVHDDASTDRTADIIREYEKKHDNIIAIYQTENQYTKGIKIVPNYIRPRMRGKYVAVCEGDDYWTDVYKLKKQVNALETHENCCMCLHKVKKILENGKKTGIDLPGKEIKTGLYLSSDFLQIKLGGGLFQTSSYMFRAKEWMKYIDNLPEFAKVCFVGDAPLLLYFGQLGSVYYFNEYMSCYRTGVPTGWTSQTTGCEQRWLDSKNNMIDTIREFDRYTSHKYCDICAGYIGKCLFSSCIIGANAKFLFKKENRLYLQKYSVAMFCFLLLSVAFPQAAKRIYWKKIQCRNRK